MIIEQLLSTIREFDEYDDCADEPEFGPEKYTSISLPVFISDSVDDILIDAGFTLEYSGSFAEWRHCPALTQNNKNYLITAMAQKITELFKFYLSDTRELAKIFEFEDDEE